MGRTIRIKVTVSLGVMQPFSFTGGNSDNCFYLVNCPFPLQIRTDTSSQATYFEQTGESFGNKPFGNAQVTALTISTPPALTFFYVTIWIGHASFEGYLDRRNMPSVLTGEIMQGILDQSGPPTVTNGVITIPTGTVAVDVPLAPSDPTTVEVGVIVGVMLGNQSLTSFFTVTDYNGHSLATIFPQQLIRLPLSLIAAGNLPQVKLKYDLYVSNSSGNTILASACLIIVQNQNLLPNNP